MNAQLKDRLERALFGEGSEADWYAVIGAEDTSATLSMLSDHKVLSGIKEGAFNGAFIEWLAEQLSNDDLLQINLTAVDWNRDEEGSNDDLTRFNNEVFHASSRELIRRIELPEQDITDQLALMQLVAEHENSLSKNKFITLAMLAKHVLWPAGTENWAEYLMNSDIGEISDFKEPIDEFTELIASALRKATKPD